MKTSEQAKNATITITVEPNKNIRMNWIALNFKIIKL